MELPEIINTQTMDERLTSLITSDKKAYLVTEKVEDTLYLMRITRNLYVKYSSRTKVVSKLVELHQVTERTAWRLAEKTPRLFSVALRQDSREFHVDIHLEKIEETRRLAIASGDFKTAAACDANRAYAIEKFLGSAQALKPEDLVLPDIEMAFRPELFKELPPVGSLDMEKIIASFKKRKRTQAEIVANEIEYEETA